MCTEQCANLPIAEGNQREGYAAFVAGCSSNVWGSSKVSDSCSWLGAESAQRPWPAAQNLPNRMPAGMEMMNQVIRMSDSFMATFLLLSRQGNRLKLNASAWQRCNQYAEAGWSAWSTKIKKRSRSPASIHSTIFDISPYSQRAIPNHDRISSIGRLWWYSYCVVSFHDSYFTPISASNICGRSPVNCH